MIILFTDFGTTDPYIGQMKAVLAQAAPNEKVIDLFHHVPNFDIRAAAYLLPAYINEFTEGSVFVCVVDPGVGGDRDAVVVEADGRWFVGPDNGLFSILIRRAVTKRCWKPGGLSESISATFHGRDVFAPVAAQIASGEMLEKHEVSCCGSSDEWPDDYPCIVHIDHFGNLVTGYRYASLSEQVNVMVNVHIIKKAHTFSDVEEGEAFYYCNSNGLLEIAVNKGSAAFLFGARTGDKVGIQ